jgi:hypothetical protein
MIELTEQQVHAMSVEKAPLHVLNPRTQEVFVLIRQDVYKIACAMAGGRPGQVWGDQDDDLIRRDS